ncbi:hypothetical protein E3J74_09150 [Candidatus Bathyarchaeota archaeon]|nr:MAG: hypothetical protein E3J74_09150 [Candidatus Bathyarchaeota archaeon]
MTWIRPEGHNDVDSVWNEEAKAYDGDLETYSSTSINILQWSSFLYFYLPPTKADKVRFYVNYSHVLSLVDVDVKIGGTWVDVYEGTFTRKTWIEKLFGSGVVNHVRIRFYRSGSVPISLIQLSEVMLHAVDDKVNGKPPDYAVSIPLILFVGLVLLFLFLGGLP